MYYIIMQILFAKCIGLLIWLEGEKLTKQNFYSAFYPHQTPTQRISKSAF